VPPFDQAANILFEFSDQAAVRAGTAATDAQNAQRMAWILLIAFSVAAV
jgi:hypothetical protein